MLKKKKPESAATKTSETGASRSHGGERNGAEEGKSPHDRAREKIGGSTAPPHTGAGGGRELASQRGREGEASEKGRVVGASEKAREEEVSRRGLLEHKEGTVPPRPFRIRVD